MIEDRLENARKGLDFLNRGEPDLASLRVAAAKAQSRRSAFWVATLCVVLIVAAAAGSQGLRGSSPDAQEVAVGGGAPEMGSGSLVIDQSTVPPQGGEVQLTVSAPRSEGRSYSTYVVLSRVEGSEERRMGRLYLDESEPILDPSLSIGYHAPTTHLEASGSNQHRLAVPQLESGAYVVEVVLYRVDGDGAWVDTEPAKAHFTVP